MLMSFQKIVEEASAEAGMERIANIIHDIQDYHTGTTEVAALAQRANVKKTSIEPFGAGTRQRHSEKHVSQ
jgi:hypothetical protein